jgi:hypothetical protein
MRRFIVIGLAAALMFAAWLAEPSSGLGCHGGCHGPGASPPADTRVVGSGGPGVTPTLLGSAPLSPADGRSVDLIKITLEPGATSDSDASRKESTLFYVQSGTIEFSGPSVGALSHQPGDPAVSVGADGSLTVSPGGVLQHDPGSVLVVNYKNVGSDPAVLIIAAVPPAFAGATPPPS